MSHYSYEEAMGAVLTTAGIKHFSAVELCRVGRLANGAGPALKPPPADLLTAPIPTLKILDELREWARAPVIITSGYRDPQYNRAIGSTDGSQHVRFTAFDVQVRGKTPAEVYSWLVRHPEALKMGIGRYATFTHVDTRGHRARW